MKFQLRQLFLLPILLAVGSSAFSQSSPAASKFIFSTYLGGTGFDEGFSGTTDVDGNVYVTGLTSSAVFPGTDSGLAGADNSFVSKFSAGGQLLYTRRIGGAGFTEALGIAVDHAGNVYITGQTNSADFPIVNGLQPNYGGGFSDAFVAKFDSSGALVYSTFLGGLSPMSEFGNAIAADDAGIVYVAGTTSAPDFPLQHPFQSAYGGGSSDGFVVKIDTNVAGRAGLVYATYLGSVGFESANAIAVDTDGNAFVSGAAACCFPTTPNAVQPFIGQGIEHAFATKLSASGQMLYSTLIGGTNFDAARGIAVDQQGVMYVVGETQSPNFLTTPQAFQLQMPGTLSGFIAVIDPSLSGLAGLRYSSYLGGSGFNSAAAVAVDRLGRVYMTGRTASADFPTRNPLQAALAGQDDAFVVQLDPSLDGAAGLTYGTFLGSFRDDQGIGIALSSSARVAVVGFTDTPFPIASAFQQAPGGSRDAFVTYLSRDTTPPLLALPADTAINATSPAGATFNFAVTATDLEDPNPVVQCSPESASLFAIGTTQIVCTAADASANSASGSFQVTVKGSQEQLGDLKEFVSSLALDKGLTNALKSKLNAAQQDSPAGACRDLHDFISQVSAKTGSDLTSDAANQLTMSATRIAAVMGCQ